MRERLIELIRKARKAAKETNCELEREHLLADVLLENGVIFAEDSIKMMQSVVENIEEKLKNKLECIEHPIGKTIIAMVIKEVLVPAIEEVGEEAENGKAVARDDSK